MWLLLSSCQPHQWTCRDGQCISRHNRCDKYLDCHDQSDESNCTQIIMSKTYNKKRNPPAFNGVLPVEIQIYITNVKKLMLTSFSLTIDMMFVIRWQESRVRFKFLKEELNRLEIPEQLWIPTFYIEDESESPVKIYETFRALFVRRNTESEISAIDEVDEG